MDRVHTSFFFFLVTLKNSSIMLVLCEGYFIYYLDTLKNTHTPLG